MPYPAAFTNRTTNTWPIVLFSAVRFGLTPAVNALATIMLTITVLAVIITAIVLRRSRVRAAPGQDQTGGLDIAVGLRWPAGPRLSGPGRSCRTPRAPSGWPRPRRR